MTGDGAHPVPDSGSPPLPRDPFALAALLLAIDPTGLRGVVLEGPTGPAPELWAGRFRELLPGRPPWRRVPTGITVDRLVGGVDLAATLALGRRVLLPGVLAQADRGVVVLPSAERLPPEVASPLLEACDRGRIRIEREGISDDLPARVAVVALDEAREGEAPTPEALRDRLAFLLPLPPRWTPEGLEGWNSAHIGTARALLADIELPDSLLRQLTVQADGPEGPVSLRPLLHALRAARALAALCASNPLPSETLARIAGALVLSPRGFPLPEEADGAESEDSGDQSSPPPQEPDSEAPGSEPAPPEPATREAPFAPPPAADSAATPSTAPGSDSPPPTGSEDDVPGSLLLPAEIARALLPEGLLEGSRTRGRSIRAAPGTRGGGELTRSHERGRRVGAEAGTPGRGRRLDLPATLRAAAPWQAVRRREAGATDGAAPIHLRIERSDLHVQRRVRSATRRTIFTVDASGSQALRRLGEVKGAVELLLADAYRRREEVALVVFRNREAHIVLPPTRSLTRAKRLLRGLVGGGGTPLARGLETAAGLATEATRSGTRPRIILLSDGRPNVDREGRGGRSLARSDAMAMARHLGASGVPLMVLDTSARGEPFLNELAEQMGTRAHHLPYADARGIRRAVSHDAEAHP
ncbi:MAG: VWA domain-containing protein [Gemmatimonadales bacterium]|nr:MAG: VWA domain-containing protein [Gemmatimonadales bacterium]